MVHLIDVAYHRMFLINVLYEQNFYEQNWKLSLVDTSLFNNSVLDEIVRAEK